MSEDVRVWVESILKNYDQELASGDISSCCCEDIIDQLFEFVDHQLSGTQEVRLAAHISGCKDCTERTEAEAHVRRILRQSCQEEAPNTLRQRIVSQIEIYRSATS